jgi:glycosyltransferase involved in cell wall biosynthesis
MEEHILVLARGLVERGVDVAVICSDRDAIEPLRFELGRAGVRVHALPERSAGPARGLPVRLRALIATLRQYPSGVLHLHLTGHNGGELVAVAGRLANMRAILRTEHLPPMPPITQRERRLVQVRDLLMDRVICVSQQTRMDHIQQLGRDPRKLVSVANCVDIERFRPSVDGTAIRRELGLTAEHHVIGTVSRFGEHRKGLNFFVDMASVVVAAYPAARFVMVGDGPLRSELEAQAASLGILDRVVFTGARRDIPELLAAMDVFVMPSLYEGGPITVLEAMALAKPVVATPVGMVPEAITDGVSGLIVPPADSGALSRAVLSLLSDPELATRLGRNGRQVVTARFSPDALVDGVVDVYRSVTNGSAPLRVNRAA